MDTPDTFQCDYPGQPTPCSEGPCSVLGYCTMNMEPGSITDDLVRKIHSFGQTTQPADVKDPEPQFITLEEFVRDGYSLPVDEFDEFDQFGFDSPGCDDPDCLCQQPATMADLGELAGAVEDALNDLADDVTKDLDLIDNVVLKHHDDNQREFARIDSNFLTIDENLADLVDSVERLIKIANSHHKLITILGSTLGFPVPSDEFKEPEASTLDSVFSQEDLASVIAALSLLSGLSRNRAV